MTNAAESQKTRNRIAAGLGGLGSALYGAYAYENSAGADRAESEPFEVAIYLHDEAWTSRAAFTGAFLETVGAARQAMAKPVPGRPLFRLFRRSETDVCPPAVAATLPEEALPLAGAPVHREVSWARACEAPHLHLVTNAVQYWRQVAWQSADGPGFGPGMLAAMSRRLQDLAVTACGAAGEWCRPRDAFATLRRVFPELEATLDEHLAAGRLLGASPDDAQALRRARAATLLFAEELSDRTLPLVTVPSAARTTETRRSAARAPAPVLTPDVEAVASQVRSRLRSALICLLAVRTPFAPFTLVAVLDDLMPTPLLRLGELAPPGGASGPPVLFLRQSELPLLGTGAHADQYRFPTHLYPYMTTALFAGSRLLHGEEIRPTLPTPGRPAAAVAILMDLQFHLRPHLMFDAALTGVTPQLSARALREFDHLMAVGLWLNGDDAIDPHGLRTAFFQAFPDFPHRADVSEADFTRDHVGWCWAWEVTAHWLKRQATHRLPPDLRGTARA